MPSIRIKGMRCRHCVGSVTEALAAIDGIVSVAVNLETGEAIYQESKPVAREAVAAAIARIGFETE